MRRKWVLLDEMPCSAVSYSAGSFVGAEGLKQSLCRCGSAAPTAAPLQPAASIRPTCFNKCPEPSGMVSAACSSQITLL